MELRSVGGRNKRSNFFSDHDAPKTVSADFHGQDLKRCVTQTTSSFWGPKSTKTPIFAPQCQYFSQINNLELPLLTIAAGRKVSTDNPYKIVKSGWAIEWWRHFQCCSSPKGRISLTLIEHRWKIVNNFQMVGYRRLVSFEVLLGTWVFFRMVTLFQICDVI